MLSKFRYLWLLLFDCLSPKCNSLGSAAPYGGFVSCWLTCLHVMLMCRVSELRDKFNDLETVRWPWSVLENRNSFRWLRHKGTMSTFDEIEILRHRNEWDVKPYYTVLYHTVSCVRRTLSWFASWSSCAVRRKSASASWRKRTRSSNLRWPSCAPRWKQYSKNCRTSWTPSSDSSSKLLPTASCSRVKRTGQFSTVVERRSLTGDLSLSCARPAADGWPLMWVNRPL